MAATEDMSIVTELIREVESYLPDMGGFLCALAGENSSHNEENVKELHRMTHTIKGAAAMVQLNELSRSALLMEDVLDDILAGKRTWNAQLIEVMSETLDHIASYCAALHKEEADGAALYQKTLTAFENVDKAFSANAAVSDDSSHAEDDLLALLGDDEEEESTDDFFQQLSDEEESAGSGDELEMLLGGTDDDSEDGVLDAFLETEGDDFEESTLEGATEEESVAPESGPEEVAPDTAVEESPGIMPELQESFDEEAEEHLENIGRQLNALASAVSERVAVSDEYRERLHSIRRSVHTLKGAAAVIGIEPVAAWGHDFEDFLDILHDESDTLSPETIAAMLDGADILEKIAINPGEDMSTEISALQDIFPSIMANYSISEEGVPEESAPPLADEAASEEPTIEPDIPELTAEQSSEEIAPRDTADTDERAQSNGIDTAMGQIFHEELEEEAVAKTVVPLRISASKESRRQARKRTLRVGSEKIAELMGLGGDMAINLSSFENSTSSMQSSLAELELTLQRLKGIASSLEAGYELDSIPHLGAAATIGQGEYGITDEFDPLEMDRYSELHILIRSLNEAVVDLDSIRAQTSDVQGSWRRVVDRQRRVVSDMQGAVQSIQMTPFSTLANRLYKTVRESARATSKNIRLLIEGGSIEMDTHIWDVLADALMHMLRNCVDHGVESLDQRQQAGKSKQATIRINCSRRGSRFVLQLSDDGGGLDYDAIRSRALQLYPGTGVEKMDDRGLAALIFKQGFSVREKASSLSGRGVGMDVVRDALDQLNGFIEVHSNPGQGTDFVLSMPIVVAQLPALMVMFGRQQFAVPMRDVNRVVRISDEEKKADTFELGDESLSLLRPAELLHLKRPAGSAVSRTVSREDSLALVVETGGRRGVLVADAVIGQRNVVFKSLGAHLQNIPCVAGATILGDGSLVPILQIEDLFSFAETAVQPGDAHVPKSGDEEKVLEILIADDSISVRKVLSNFISAHGWQVAAAHDGVAAMEKIRERKPDLILLDIEMPRMNGFEVLQTLQTQSAYRDIPVLMLTSRSADKYREKAEELGARGFVTKPFKDDELLSLISGLTAEKTI